MLTEDPEPSPVKEVAFSPLALLTTLEESFRNKTVKKSDSNILDDIQRQINTQIYHTPEESIDAHYEEVSAGLYSVFIFIRRIAPEVGIQGIFKYWYSVMQSYHGFASRFKKKNTGFTFVKNKDGLFNRLLGLSEEQIKNGKQENEELCMESAMVDLCEHIYAYKDTLWANTVAIELIVSMFMGIKQAINQQIFENKYLDMSLINKICMSSLSSLRWIFSLDPLRKSYIERLETEEMVPIGFFFTVLSINLYTSAPEERKIHLHFKDTSANSPRRRLSSVLNESLIEEIPDNSKLMKPDPELQGSAAVLDYYCEMIKVSGI